MGNVSALCVEDESTLKALWRMWALSQALSVGRGLAGRKAQARPESSWSPQMHCAGPGGGRHVVCQETQRRPARFGLGRLRALHSWATGEFPALFPTPNESSFRTLTCLLAWPQEGNDAACPESPRLCLNSEHQKRGTSLEAPIC